MAMKRAPLGSRATPVDAYLLLFIAVGFFLMCAVSPNTHIAVADSGIERQIHRQTNQQQTAHADEPAGSADQAAACDTLNRPPDGKADAVDQAVCRNSAQFFDKPAQRCQNPRIGAVRRGTYRCRTEFIPQTAEYRVWVRLPDTVKESRDSALVVPCAQTHQQPHEQTVFK